MFWVSVERPTIATEITTEIDQEHQAKIERLMEMTGAKDMGMQLATFLIQSMNTSIQESQPNIPPARALDIASEVTLETIESNLDSMYAELIPLYAKYYSEEDLDIIIAFYETPTGQKLIQTQSSLLQESMQIGESWGRRMKAEIQRKIQERLQSEGIIPNPK